MDPRYQGLAAELIPDSESLAVATTRILPYWSETIAPAVAAGQRVLVVAHGNSLRALIKHLDRISDEVIVDLEVPTGIPLVYTLDAGLRPLHIAYLSDTSEPRSAIADGGVQAPPTADLRKFPTSEIGARE